MPSNLPTTTSPATNPIPKLAAMQYPPNAVQLMSGPEASINWRADSCEVVTNSESERDESEAVTQVERICV